jgi:CoA:oxalate CoA-transferase
MGPLKGVRILDLSRLLAGPFGTMILSDMGAEVIKVEQPEKGDGSRGMPPYFLEGESAYYLSMNRNKKSMTLNLKSEEGRNIFYSLVKKADVVYENYRPGVMERLGIGYETLKEINPKIIYCSVSGYGQTGVYRDRPAFDLVIQAMGGIMSFTGSENGEPSRMGVPMGDLGGGIYAAHGVLAALYEREKSGKGKKIDISMLDVQVSLLTYRALYYFINGDVPSPIGAGHVSAVPIGAFKTKSFDIVVDANTEEIWVRLCNGLNIQDLAEDPRFCNRGKRLENKELLLSMLQDVFLQKTGEEWIDKLNEAQVPAGPINTVDKILNDPHIKERNMVLNIDHPKAGLLKLAGNPIKFEGESEEGKYTYPPMFGEHTDEILQSLLDLNESEIINLKNNKVL